MRPIKIEPAALTVVSGYEFAAMVSGRLPTVTSMVRACPRWVRRSLPFALAWWAWHHFD